MTDPPAPIPKNDIPNPPSANTPKTHKNTHTNSTKHQEVNGTISTPYRRDGHTKSSIASQKNNDTNDTQMVDNPYNVEDTRERFLNNEINIKFEPDIYTPPITIDIHQQQDKGSINPVKLHRDFLRRNTVV